MFLSLRQINEVKQTKHAFEEYHLKDVLIDFFLKCLNFISNQVIVENY